MRACVIKQTRHWAFSNLSPFEGHHFFLFLLYLNLKMETLLKLKNNQFLMGLCRNGPPPDLQYDNSSGSTDFFFI